LLIVTGLNAQSYQYKDYDWDPKPAAYKPTPEESKETQMDLFNKSVTEFVIDKTNAYEVNLKHTRLFVNSDEAIERNNRIYIPFSQYEEILTNKVRVIKPSGEVVNITDNDIKEAEDEESKVKYKYFALRGLEIGSTIEQLVVRRGMPKYTGKNINLQDEYPSKNVSVELIYPPHLIFKIKTYNALPAPQLNDSLYKNKISQKIEVDYIPPLRKEEYSNYNANLKRLSYKLAGNLYTGRSDLFNYREYAENLYNSYSQPLTGKENKKLEAFMKNCKQSKDPQDLIFDVESYIKKNIQYIERYDGKEDIATTVENKYTNIVGLIKLYGSIFEKNKINYQVVVVSNRYSNPIDPKFDNYQNLDDYAFYFPDYKKYLSPSDQSTRYPFISYIRTNTYGLFVGSTELGGAKIADYDIKFIETPSIDFTRDSMLIDVDFKANVVKPKVHSRLQFTGYTASNFQPYFDFFTATEADKFKQSLAENYCGQKDNITATTENGGSEYLGKKPFILDVNFEASKLIEKTGDKILFKVGETIGRQSELYQKDKRVLPIEIQYPHYYDRTITVTLPDGYVIKNLDPLKMNLVTMYKDKESCKFISDYKLTGNVLTIHNIEFYSDVNLPVELYPDYAKVINAAADFNKIVLVLEKQ